MTESAEQMHSYYAARAGEYDRVYRKPERQSDLRAIEEWLPARFAGMSVLEVACGTGYWTRLIAPHAARVVALDAAAETIAVAEARVPKEKVAFVVGDAYDLPEVDGGFDAAFAGFWFSHVPIERRREFIAGLGRSLKPGARVVLLDNRFVAGSSSPISEKDAVGNAFQLRALEDGSTHRVLKNFPTELELRAAVSGCGVDATLTEWQYFWAFEYLVAGE